MICVCDKAISKLECLTNCPKGIILKSNKIYNTNWKKDITSFIKKEKEDDADNS